MHWTELSSFSPGQVFLNVCWKQERRGACFILVLAAGWSHGTRPVPLPCAHTQPFLPLGTLQVSHVPCQLANTAITLNFSLLRYRPNRSVTLTPDSSAATGLRQAARCVRLHGGGADEVAYFNRSLAFLLNPQFFTFWSGFGHRERLIWSLWGTDHAASRAIGTGCPAVLLPHALVPKEALWVACTLERRGVALLVTFYHWILLLSIPRCTQRAQINKLPYLG